MVGIVGPGVGVGRAEAQQLAVDGHALEVAEALDVLAVDLTAVEEADVNALL
ncbi:hypothetical protein D3C80_2146030 [compost metagenome]